jgi:hypothetical protein
MELPMSNNQEFEKFDNTMQKILSVSREELQRRETEWKRGRKKKKRTKTSPASRASNAKA